MENIIHSFDSKGNNSAISVVENQNVSLWKKIASFVKRPEYFFWLAAFFALLLFLQGEFPGAPAAASQSSEAIAPALKNPYDETEIFAKSAFVYDIKARRELFGRDENTPYPLASLTKLMTAATALSLIPETTLINISMEALNEEGDSGLRPGESWILRDLLKLMLVESSNDAAAAVSSSVGAIASGAENPKDIKILREFFIGRMNELARSFGLPKTHFLNETGLDVDGKTAGGIGTAKEAALLLARILEKAPLIFSATRWNEMKISNSDGGEHTAKNTNRDTDKFPLLLASKTGYTDLAGGNLIIAFDAGFNRPIIISVLGSTVEKRFTDAENLLWATLEFLVKNNK